MARPLVRNLTLGSLGLVIVGIILLVAGVAGSTITTSVDTTGATVPSSVSGGNPLLFGGGILLVIVGAILHLVAYVGALIKTAQIQQWVWFVLILLLGTIPLLIYSFVGPDAPAMPQMPPGYPPQGPYGQQYPPQYPQQPPPYQQPPQ